SWAVTRTSWRERIAWVEPTEEEGRSQWLGTGQPLHFDLCRAVRRVLSRGEVGVPLTRRGRQALETLAGRSAWVDEGSTAVVRDSGGTLRWWTFAGLAANTVLAALLGPPLHKEGARGENLAIPLASEASASDLERRLGLPGPDPAGGPMAVTEEALEGLKFHACLPRDLAGRVVAARLADPEGVRKCLEEPVRLVDVGNSREP
ncbi:MAG: ATP-dependent helicase, partial [bacterium]|nr:ATP-dependent helicase [bacterium]